MSWKKRFEDLDRAPWPGPEPIRFELPQLPGRSDDADRFLAAVLDHSLVVLTADSGVGKSSLLNAKLIPGLRQERFQPVLIDQWSFDDDDRPGDFIADQVADELDVDRHGDPEDPPFWERVDAAHGDRLVIVLDQFEELVRFQSRLFRETIAWISNLNRSSRIRVVLSLRAEFVHQLRDLEKSARPFTYTTFRLEPIDDGTIIEAIVAGFDGEGGIEVEAIGEVVRAWTGLRKEDRPGLLGLQGLLYALHHRVNDPERDMPQEVDTEDVRWVTAKDVGDLVAEAQRAELTAFEHGLSEAARYKIQHCREASEAAELDRLLVDGAEAVLVRILPLLSSGGFKLVLDQRTIAMRALEREIRRLGLGDAVVARIYKKLSDASARNDDTVFTNTWHQADDLLPEDRMARLADKGVPAGEYAHRDWVSWRHADDPRVYVTSGAMADMPSEAVLYQVLRRFWLAMEWLEASSLVRRTAPKKGTTMVALIHDGFGEVLERGIDMKQRTLHHLLAEVVAPSGEQLPWTDAGLGAYRMDVADRAGGAVGPLVLANLRWRDCALSGEVLSDLVFVNGDFRGTRFDGCTFQGVTFVNCLLDNASFIDCHFVGAPGAARPAGKDDVLALTAGGDPDLPDFRVAVPDEEVDLVGRYRRTPLLAPRAAGVPAQLYSRTSGVAAHPIVEGSTRSGITLGLARGGLAMYGGRLSSLMVRGGTFHTGRDSDGEEQPGTLSLRHIAGASLDLVEHEGGRLEIVDSTIRGLTVTSRIDAAGESGQTEIHVVTAVIGNAWFGTGLQGSATFTDCQILQLVNLNDDGALEVHADLIDDETIPVGVFEARSDLDGAFADAARRFMRVLPLEDLRKMDYRRRPAEIELDQGSAG